MGNVVSMTEEDGFETRYKLGKQLGKGAQGRVHFCLDRDTGVARAVKIIDRSSNTAWTTFRREVDLCKEVIGTCPNIIRVLEEFSDSSTCYVVMEKFEGHLRKSLKWVAKEAGQEERLGLCGPPLGRTIRQALVAIAHLHKHNIIHRDVKAHNLLTDRLDLRDPRCRIVLSDFGLARRLEPGKFLNAQVGTRKYWAPELYTKKYWNQVDIFSLGVVLLLVASGEYPFQDEEQTRHRDIFADGLVPAELEVDARSFLKLALCKDPNQRPTASQMLTHPWIQQDDMKALFARNESSCGSSQREFPAQALKVSGQQEYQIVSSFGPKAEPTPLIPAIHGDEHVAKAEGQQGCVSEGSSENLSSPVSVSLFRCYAPSRHSSQDTTPTTATTELLKTGLCYSV